MSLFRRRKVKIINHGATHVGGGPKPIGHRRVYSPTMPLDRTKPPQGHVPPRRSVIRRPRLRAYCLCGQELEQGKWTDPDGYSMLVCDECGMKYRGDTLIRTVVVADGEPVTVELRKARQ